MVMRYHWGLAAGHTYAHVTSTMSEPEMPASTNGTTWIEEPDTSSGAIVNVRLTEGNQNDDDDDDPELS